MRLHRCRALLSYLSLPKRSRGRWIVVAGGLAVLVAALAAAAEPYRQTREFREVVACDRDGADCFGREPAFIVGRRTFTTTTTHTDVNGRTSTTTTYHYELTWQRADGSRHTRLVSSGFYDEVHEGQPADLRLWREQVVGIEVTGAAEWFLPESGNTLGYWLYLAFLGLGVLLWGLLFGWWDGFFLLGFRTIAWMLMSVSPITITTNAVAYGLDVGAGLVVTGVFGVLSIVVAGWLLLFSLRSW